jgi:hypothetical protein
VSGVKDGKPVSTGSASPKPGSNFTLDVFGRQGVEANGAGNVSQDGNTVNFNLNVELKAGESSRFLIHCTNSNVTAVSGMHVSVPPIEEVPSDGFNEVIQ